MRYGFGQLSQIQRARLASLTSPAASAMIIDTVLSQERDHRHERDAFVAVDESMILGKTERIGRRQLGQSRLLVVPFVCGPLERGAQQALIAQAGCPAKST